MNKLLLTLFFYLPLVVTPQVISLNLDNPSIKMLILEVESQTDFKFAYGDEVDITTKLKGSFNFHEENLKKVIQELSKRTHYRLRILGNSIAIIKDQPKKEPEVETNLQFKVQGTVTDPKGMPLPGASVIEKGTSNGVMTNFDGEFNIEVSPDAILQISYLGYDGREVAVNGQTAIKITLKPSASQLAEVVVTALGIKREEKALGYSVQSISGEAVQAVKGVDVATSLTGKVAGLWIQNSTEFNEAPDIRLRGGASPLLVIDGVPYGNMGLNDIAADDIGSISVLKGATASALYGARGGGGAIIITTKSGGNGLFINSNTMVFAGYLALPEVQDSYSAGLGGNYSATDYVWGAKLDIGTVAEQWNPVTKQYEDMPLTSRGKNNFKEFLEPSIITNNNITFARSGDLGSIRTSITHIYNKGQYPNLESNKLNMNVSGTLNLGEDFELQSSLGYNRSMAPQTTGAGYGDQGYMYQILLWTGPEYDLSKYRDYWVIPNEKQNWHYKSWYDNPYLIAYEKLAGEVENITNASLTAKYDLFEGAKITGRIGYDFYSNEYTKRNPPGINSTRGWDVNGLYSRQQTNGYSLNMDLLFNYNKEDLIPDLDIDITAGGSLYKYKDQGLYASTRAGIIVPGIYSLNNSVERPNVSSYRNKKQVNSLLALASISYLDAFYVDVTGRNDWSSTQPASSRSYFYPSVSGSVVLSELIGVPDWTDFWKIRGSWTVSKEDLGVYDTNINYGVSQGVWNGLNTANYPSTIKSSDVKPETSRSWEIGTAAYFFKSRLKVDVAYYNIYRYNRQVFSSIPASSGFTSTLINTNETRERRGLELIIDAGIIDKKDFTWDASFNISKTHAYYKDLDSIYSPDNLWVKEGGRVDNYVITDWLRTPQGQVIHNSGGLPIQSNYSSFYDYSDPDFIWGFTNSFKYKNFNLHFSFDGRVGGTSYNYTAYKMWDTGSHPDSDNKWRYDEVVNGNISYVGNGVQVASGSVTYDQYGQIVEDTRTYTPNSTAVSYESYARRYADGKFGATDATFFKLREIAIGYTFPKEMSEKWGIEKANVSITAQNVFLWTKEYRFADPDWNSDSELTSPSQRFVGVNLALQF